MDVARLACYERNLKALADRQPTVAGRVESTPVPSGLKLVAGRDGTLTFRLPCATDRSVWLGGSSMPRVSSREILGDAVYSGGNAALPGMLTGLEPLVLLERFPGHAALFVIENDPLFIKLAFHLYDYSAVIGSGRLVLVLADAFADSLTELVRRYPGYEMPSHLYHVPQWSAAQLAELQRELEREGRAAVDAQAQRIQEALAAIRGRTFGAVPRTPRVALLSSNVRPGSLRQVRRVARALAGLGWDHVVSMPDVPEKCHVAALLCALERSRADLVLFANDDARAVRGALPPALPIVSWWVGGADVPVTADGSSCPHDLLVVSGAVDGAVVEGGAVGGTRVVRLMPAADEVAFPWPDSADRTTDSNVDVSIAADLPDDRAEACGMHLQSHAVLWAAVRRIVGVRVDQSAALSAGELLALAERETGVAVSNAAMRSRMIALIQERVMPAAVGRSLAVTCGRAGLRVFAFGSNWDVGAPDGIHYGGGIPERSGEHLLFDAAGVLIVPTCHPPDVQTALDGLSGGKRVCVRGTADEFNRLYPELHDVAEHMVFAPRSRTLAGVVKQMCRRGEAGKPSESVRSQREVLSRHTFKVRVQLIVDAVRAIQSS